MNASIRRSGLGAAAALVIGCFVYMANLVAVLVSGVMPPLEPYQSIISVDSMLAGPLLIFLLAVLRQEMTGHRRIYITTSLALATIFTTLTCINRYVALTVVRQSLDAGITSGLEWFMPYGTHSIMAAIEVLAWGFFLGLTFLSLSPVFCHSDGTERALFWTLIISGIFCLAGTVGQVVNSEILNLLGAAGWGVGFLLISILLALRYWRVSAAALPEKA